MKLTWKDWATHPMLIGFAACGALWGATTLWQNYKPAAPAGGDSVPVQSSPVVKKAPVVAVAIKAPVKTFQGQTKVQLKLPPIIIADAAEQVIAASKVTADLHPQTVTTVINTDTGAVQSFVKTEPYPWLAIENRGEASVIYGYKFRAGDFVPKPVGRLQVKYDAVRVKALTVGVTASVDSDRDAFAGVSVSYKW